MPECRLQGPFQPLEVAYRDGVLWIKGPETIDTDHFRKNHLPNLVEQYKRFGFGNLAVDIQVCQEMTQQQAEIFHAQNAEIYQQANEENLAALEQLAQMAPPPEQLSHLSQNIRKIVLPRSISKRLRLRL